MYVPSPNENLNKDSNPKRVKVIIGTQIQCIYLFVLF